MRGALHHGGGGIRLLDAQQKWAAPTKLFPPGPFVTTLEAPTDGDYQIVLFNNLEPGATSNNVEITEIGPVDLELVSIRAANTP